MKFMLHHFSLETIISYIKKEYLTIARHKLYIETNNFVTQLHAINGIARGIKLQKCIFRYN